MLSHELFLAVHPSGVDALRCVPVIDALEVGQSAYPPRIPEVALRTALAPSGVKRCTGVGWSKPLANSRGPARRRVSSWCKPCSYRSVKAGNERLRLEVLGALQRRHDADVRAVDRTACRFWPWITSTGTAPPIGRKSGAGASFYRWLKQNRFPPGLQVLCHNCNLAKSAYGSCPHTRKTPRRTPGGGVRRLFAQCATGLCREALGR